MPDQDRRLLEDPVAPTLRRLAWPMLLGIAAIVVFNVVDTFWVGRLGPEALAAMSFTFPVVMVVTSLAMGISVGATAVIARAIGESEQEAVRRLTSAALLLALLVVGVVAAVGLVTLGPLFRALGASEELLPLVAAYMVPWYLGVGLLVVPMVGNGAIRATGDTRTPSLVMVVAGLTNAVLDPLLIFGIGPFPALGLQGAALATVGSYSLALIAALYLLGRRLRLLCRPTLASLPASWRRILRIGLPAAATFLIGPVAIGLLTRLVSGHGDEAVAGFGVGTRIESLALIPIGALSTAVTPFIAQNLGANNCERIRAAVRACAWTALVVGLGAALVLAILARPLGRLFNSDPVVIAAAASYLWAVPLSFPGLALAQLMGSCFNALDRPLRATFLVAVRLVGLAVPLAALGSALFGLIGLFGGIAAANLAVGGLALWLVRRQLSEVEQRAPRPAPAVAPA
ncbi:MAG TPA: MATE family efflux transporter [Planctomycetes bacterium]|nr:MATE family efflux transporter [Planctomycetota bacterium]